MPRALVRPVTSVHVSMPRRAYYEDGSRASGPPPRGLFEYEYQVRARAVVRGGQLPTLSRPV